MVSGGRPLIAIGYKYNMQKVLSFIVTEKSGSTQSGIPYLSKYFDQFTNVAIFTAACLLVMSRLFGAFNEFDSHKKCRQSGFALEKFWVTQCGWLWLCTAVSMDMTITNFWKLLCCGVKRYHYEELISFR